MRCAACHRRFRPAGLVVSAGGLLRFTGLERLSCLEAAGPSELAVFDTFGRWRLEALILMLSEPAVSEQGRHISVAKHLGGAGCLSR
jgi:hypothetical protein